MAGAHDDHSMPAVSSATYTTVPASEPAAKPTEVMPVSHASAPVASGTGAPKPPGNSTEGAKPSGSAVPSAVPEGRAAAMVLPGVLGVLAVVAAGMVVM